MLLTPHALMGTVIGANIKNPLISIPLALLSHFVLDLFPHINPRSVHFTKASYYPLYIVDLGFGLISGIAFAPKYGNIVIITSIVAMLPDLLLVPLFLFHLELAPLVRLRKIQSRLQFHVNNVYIGSISQILVMFLCLVYLIRG